MASSSGVSVSVSVNGDFVVFVIFFVWTVLIWLLFAFEIGWAFFAVGANLDSLEVAMMTVVGRASFIVPLPGGLGLFEATQRITGSWCHIPAASLIAVCALFRAADFLLVVVGLALGERRRTGSREHDRTERALRLSREHGRGDE